LRTCSPSRAKVSPPPTPVLSQAQAQSIASQVRESDPEFDIFFEEDFARFKKKNYPGEEAKKSGADHDKNAKAKMGKRLAKHGMSARPSLLNQLSKYQTPLSNQSVSDGGPSLPDSPESSQKNVANDESVRIRALGRGFHKPVCNQYSMLVRSCLPGVIFIFAAARSTLCTRVK
jgi:hypothetical protein